MSTKTQGKHEPEKRETLDSICAMFTTYLEEKLKNTTKVLEILNKPGLQRNIQTSLTDIKELKEDMREYLDTFIKRVREKGFKED